MSGTDNGFGSILKLHFAITVTSRRKKKFKRKREKMGENVSMYVKHI